MRSYGKSSGARRWALIASLSAVCLSSCQSPALSLNDVPGVWQSDGYGWFITVKDGKAGDVRHVENGLCLHIKDDEIGPTIAGLYPIAIAKDGSTFTAATTENITQFRFQKAVGLPEECAKASAMNPDPIVNFDAAWKYFDTHYAFFAEHKVDWEAAYRRFRPRVTPQTSPDELYAIIGAMLSELNDRHVIIDREDGRQFRAGLGPILEPWFKEFTTTPQGAENAIDYISMRMEPFKAIVEQQYIVGPIGKGGQGQIVWGRLKGDVGYIRLDSFSDYDERAGYKYQKAELETAIAAALRDLDNVKALAIDMRFNLGGNDGLGLSLMSHFADNERVVYTKQARMGSGFTVLQKVTVAPAKPRFTGKVAILIGNVTVSAGENFTIATLPFPHIFRVGETTAGALSDVLMKPLPNGWQVGISNEIFRAADGHDVEAIGIKPDINVRNHFSRQTLTTKRDMVLETALMKLTQ
jgi:carboxyl-terminal processing protease